ncbi:hypothetical protein TARUN_6578 [Trichoderma arundinaceum]|uniref:Uncharacterized protein n=1 Tax=Trichoderma arundinaceum TaxID=490622 RepID=A0A395NHX2_TRIAR|nr:hypothetical protein TARUN_6578 [Trichoderma arundinaceum]
MRFSGYGSKITSQALSSDNLYLALGLDKPVKIWDIASGVCIQSLNVGTAHYLSFDARINSRLYSTLGTLDLDLAPISGPAPAMPSSQPGGLHGYGIDEDGVWILKDGKPMLWLPLEYRPTTSDVTVYRPAVSAVAGSTVAIGCNGRVLMMRFAEAGPDRCIDSEGYLYLNYDATARVLHL